MRWAGIALLLMMPIHVALRPEHAWLLLSACDVAAIVCAIGAITGRLDVVAIAGLFALAVGLPSYAIGLATTNPINPTSFAVHIVPSILGIIAISRQGVPRRAALIAWSAYVLLMAAGYVFPPHDLNINMASKVWPPLARVFPTTLAFHAGLLAITAGLLFAGQQIAVRARRAPPARS
jgi:hypothetical protein